MGHLWLRDSERGWAVLPLRGGRLPLDGDLRALAGAGETAAFAAAPASLLCAGGAGRWVLVTERGEEVRVNGLPVELGIRALRDRDAIRVRGLGTLFFTTEMPARVVSYPGPGCVPCARCQTPIEEGDPAVACPDCGLWHHQGADAGGVERECWTYAETCAYGPHPTGLDGGFRWTPEDL